MDISFIGLSSAAMRLESILPHRRQRWTMAHSPPLRTQTATGSITPPQADALSPGSSSTCRLQRQFGQWLRGVLPAPSGTTTRPQFLQVNTSLQPPERCLSRQAGIVRCCPRCIFCKESQSLYSSYSSPSSAAMNWGTALGSMPRMYANSLCSRFCASCKARSSKAESPLPWALRAWC